MIFEIHVGWALPTRKAGVSTLDAVDGYTTPERTHLFSFSIQERRGFIPFRVWIFFFFTNTPHPIPCFGNVILTEPVFNRSHALRGNQFWSLCLQEFSKVAESLVKHSQALARERVEMRMKGLEPSHLAVLEPKSSASANSATSASVKHVITTIYLWQ